MENKTIKELLHSAIEAESLKRGEGLLDPNYLEDNDSKSIIEMVSKIANTWAEQACRKQRLDLSEEIQKIVCDNCRADVNIKIINFLAK